MSFFKSIILSLSMFSAIPMPRIEWNQKNMRYMMCTFPFVGLVIAFLCGGWFIFGQFLARWHKNLSPALIALGFTLIPVFVSGGIHLDGFMDTCDALGSHASREKKLEILKDSHSGAFAVLGCVIYFLCYFVLSLEVFKQPLHLINLAPFLGIFVISRILSAFAVSTFPIAKDSGLVHTVEATAANVHDVAEVPKLLTGEEEVVYGDSGYLGAGKREDAVVRNKSGRKIKYKINRRPSQMKKLSKSGQYAAKRAEHTKSSVRAKVEHVFGVVKKRLRFRKTRYRGLEKQQAKFNIMFALANLILADRPCLAA